MTFQASVRVIRDGERILFAGTAFSFAGAVSERSVEFSARFMAALAESRRHEAQRAIRHYCHLLGDL
jgi:hypothetical protein